MCTGCHQNRAVRIEPAIKPVSMEDKQGLVAPKSDVKAKVKIRYYGGGMSYQTSGCSSCGSQGTYALTTSETIQFPSDDEPSGWFSKRFDASHDYFVTEEQARFLLDLTYTNPSGQLVHKFKKVED